MAKVIRIPSTKGSIPETFSLTGGNLGLVGNMSLQPRGLSDEEKAQLAVKLLDELFMNYKKKLSEWAKTTGQSAQLDSGYIAQHLISVLTGIKGTGMRGKGKDLIDDSEVKTASSVAGIDVPRWNHNIGTKKAKDTFLRAPHIYYVLFDAPSKTSERVRVRVWAVTPSINNDFRTVVERWFNLSPRSYNFQLHPPVRRDDNIATNECGNLDLPLMFAAEEDESGQLAVKFFQIDYSKKSRLIERNK